MRISERNILEVHDVCRSFQVGQTKLEVLKNVNIRVKEGTFNLLLGPSGSGKTTLLNILGTLDGPDSGRVMFKDMEVTKLSEKKKDKLRRKEIGYIFQTVALVSNMTAYENVDFFLRINGMKGKDRFKRIGECLRFVGLEKRGDHYPSQMSGGEQQRVAIARSISHKPPLMLADEPTAELDTQTGLKVVHLFKKMVEEEGLTIVMCTHDRTLIEYADHVFEMEDGVIVNSSLESRGKDDGQ